MSMGCLRSASPTTINPSLEAGVCKRGRVLCRLCSSHHQTRSAEVVETEDNVSGYSLQELGEWCAVFLRFRRGRWKLLTVLARSCIVIKSASVPCQRDLIVHLAASVTSS